MRIELKKEINHYGHKNGICIDANIGFIKRFVDTPLNIHDDYIRADSAHCGVHLKFTQLIQN